MSRFRYKKQCILCSRTFIANHHNRSLCSDECIRISREVSNKKYLDRNRDVVNARARARKKENWDLYYQKIVARRRTKDGYADRFMERIRNKTPGTDISREYLLSIFGDRCNLTGVKFRFGINELTSFQNPYAPSVDRIDSSRGYVVGNVQIVLIAINLAKNEMSMEAFKLVWSDIVKNWKALTT